MLNRKPRVLIVDDEQVVCDLLHDELTEKDYLCTTALDGNDALAKLAIEDFDVVLLDIRLPGMSGMEVLREIWLNHSDTATIMITAINDVDTAVEAMKWGASDYIVKPFDLDRVGTSISTALENEKAAPKSSEMDAIARGVEAKFDPLLTLSRGVTARTIEIAQRLGIAEEEIQEWAEAKAKLDSDISRVVKSSLNKLERSPLAQSIVGATVPSYTPNRGEPQDWGKEAL